MPVYVCVSVTIIISLANNNRPIDPKIKGKPLHIRENPFRHTNRNMKNYMQSKCSLNKNVNKKTRDVCLCWGYLQIPMKYDIQFHVSIIEYLACLHV